MPETTEGHNQFKRYVEGLIDELERSWEHYKITLLVWADDQREDNASTLREVRDHIAAARRKLFDAERKASQHGVDVRPEVAKFRMPWFHMDNDDK